MRHTLQRRLWTGIVGLLSLINLAYALTCPTGTATSTADPLVISACSRLSSLVSEQAQTGGTAIVTVYITFPAPAAPGTLTTPSTTSLVSTSSSSTGPSSPQSPRTVTMTSTPNTGTGTSRSRDHSTMRTVRSHGPTESSQSPTTGPVTNTNEPSPASPASSDTAGMPPHRSNSGSDDNYTTGVVIPVAVVCTVVPVMLLLWLLWFCIKRRRRHRLAAGSPAASVEPINSPNEKDGPQPLPTTTEKPSAPGTQEGPTPEVASNPPQLAYLFGPGDETPVFPQPPSGTTQPPTPSSPPHSPLPETSLEASSVRPRQAQPSEEHSSPRRDSDEARGVGGLTALREETDQSSSAQDAESDVMGRGGTWFAPSIQEEDDEDSEPPIPQEPVPQAPKPPPIPDVSPDRQKRASSSWLSLASRHSLNSSISGAHAESSSTPPPPPPPPFPAPTSGFSTPRSTEANRGQTLRPVPYKLYPRR